MSKNPVLLSLFLVVLVALPLLAGPDMSDFSRYEVILKRRPFGAPPVKPGPPPPPPAAQVDPFKNFRLVGLTQGDDDDISVGIVDIGTKPPSAIFLGIGETDNVSGIHIVDADFELEVALVRKGPHEKWLRLGGSAFDGGSSGGSHASKSGGGTVNTQSAKGVDSYIKRMRARKAARHRKVEPPKLQGAALKKHLSEYNMELIRAAAKGESKGPPLPIQLTPAQDKQLVEEGVLPAQE